eukprot:395164_1
MTDEKDNDLVNQHKTAYSQNMMFTGANSGHYTWIINDKPLINNILNAANGKVCESKPFTMRNMQWTIQLYPNGDKEQHKGSVMIYLKLLSIPKIIQKVVARNSILCDKTFASYGNIREYTHTNNIWGFPDRSGTLLLSEWKSLNTENLAITVDVNVIKIILHTEAVSNSIDFGLLPHFWINKKQLFPDKWTFMYTFDSNTLNTFKKAYVGKSFESNVIDNTFKLQIYPHGIRDIDNGNVSFFLVLCTMCADCSKIQLKCSMTCLETKIHHEINTTYNSVGNSNGGKCNFMKTSALLALSQATFMVDIEIVGKIKEKNPECIVSDAFAMDRILSFTRVDNKGAKMDYVVIDTILSEQNKQLQQMSDFMSALNLKMKSLENIIDSKDQTIEQLKNKINKMEGYMFDEKQNNQVTDNVTNVTASILSMKKQIKQIQKDINKNNNNVSLSDKKQLKLWFTNVVKLPEYFDIFIEQGFEDLQSVKYVTANELELMGISKIGHKMKLLRFIAKLNENQNQNYRQNEGNTAQ